MHLSSDMKCAGPVCPSLAPRKVNAHVMLQHMSQRQHRVTYCPSRAAASLRTDRDERLHSSCTGSDRLEKEFQESRGGLASTSGKEHVAVLRATKSAAIPLREREKPLGALLTHC